MAVRGGVLLAITAFVGLPAAAPHASLFPADRQAKLAVVAAAEERWVDPERGVGLAAPAGWKRSPVTSLNPLSDPPDPVFELARFQLRLHDATLYAQPVPLTSGLVADAKAILSIGLARTGSELSALDALTRGDREGVASIPGFVFVDEDATYEAMRTYTRYFLGRGSDRVVVARAVAAENDWSELSPSIFGALASVRADPKGARGPAAILPPKPTPTEAIPAQPADATIEIRADILARAQLMLGITYVWGGNSTTRGMDCASFVSRAWDIERYSTDAIWQVSYPIAKEDLRPGDALNLTVGRDPRRLGHVRIFEAWANTERSTMWVYEETPPRAVHRVIAYDDRYQPIRLAGLSGAGIARVIPGTPVNTDDEEEARPAARTRPAATRPPTAKSAPRPTARPASRPTPRPAASVKPSPTPPTGAPSPTPREPRD